MKKLLGLLAELLSRLESVHVITIAAIAGMAYALHVNLQITLQALGASP